MFILNPRSLVDEISITVTGSITDFTTAICVYYVMICKFDLR